MQYITIKNWQEYQHYRDRNPPWIKLHNSILDDYEYTCLPDDSKLLLISLFLVASRTNNKIPYDVTWIKSKTMIKGKLNMQPLISSGFISLIGDDSNMLAQCKQNDSHRRGETETEKRQRRVQYSAPTLEEVKSYFKEKGYRQEIAMKAFEYYDNADWHDSSGKKVRNWKQKMIAVWFKDEHKDEKNDQIARLAARISKDG